ncbi:MAG TPA: hypothetical protein V6D17_18525 [Candidatus Obscuribacterales bacterium]
MNTKSRIVVGAILWLVSLALQAPALLSYVSVQQSWTTLACLAGTIFAAVIAVVGWFDRLEFVAECSDLLEECPHVGVSCVGTYIVGFLWIDVLLSPIGGIPLLWLTGTMAIIGGMLIARAVYDKRRSKLRLREEQRDQMEA